jgi:hypothetical protein
METPMTLANLDLALSRLKLLSSTLSGLPTPAHCAALLRQQPKQRINSSSFSSLAAVAAVLAAFTCSATVRSAQALDVGTIDARLVAVDIPGASAISQVGTFLNAVTQGACAAPIPTSFPGFIQPGAVLDPIRLLVASRSNFGAPPAIGVGADGSLLSIDPTSPTVLKVPPQFAESGGQASALGGAVQMFSANSPAFANGVKNPGAATAAYTGVSNPLGLSNNNAFGRIWPANAPFGLDKVGSSAILDPTGLPLKGPPNPVIGGVYVGALTNRNIVAVPRQPQVIPGALASGAVGTALLGPSPDGTCKAVFAVVTADGAIVQEHTLKGLDGIAPPGTVRPLLDEDAGFDDDFNSHGAEPRLGVLLNGYTQPPVLRQLFVSEPFHNSIAVIDLVVAGTAPNLAFGPGSISRIRSWALNRPVDIAAVHRDADNINWASNTSLDDGSDIYVANRGDNTIVRMSQNGSVVAVRRVTLHGERLDEAKLNGITTSVDGKTIYITFTRARPRHGGVLALPAF